MSRQKRKKSKSINNRQKRKSRNFGTKKSCIESNLQSSIISSVATGIALKLPDLFKEYSSAAIKHKFEMEKEEFKKEANKLPSEHETTIKKLKKMYTKAVNESIDSALNVDKYQHLMQLLHKHSDIPISEILDIHKLYPEDI